MRARKNPALQVGVSADFKSGGTQMRASKLAFVFVSLVFALVALPTAIVHGAGGSIEGKVTDAKGAAVAGGAVTVPDPVSNQKFSAVTDNQGHYRIEGLPPGSYAVTISAKGFSDFRRD